MTLGEALDELRLVRALARRVHRDLCHALDDFPDAHPLLELMRERCEYFGQALGDTSDYRHSLHQTISSLCEEVEMLRRENESLRRRP
jgi:hypothetical protein